MKTMTVTIVLVRYQMAFKSDKSCFRPMNLNVLLFPHPPHGVAPGSLRAKAVSEPRPIFKIVCPYSVLKPVSRKHEVPASSHNADNHYIIRRGRLSIEPFSKRPSSTHSS